MTVTLTEIQLDPNDPTRTSWGSVLAHEFHYAWAIGDGASDAVDAATLTPATQTLMADKGRGMYVDLGAGNDTAVGTGQGDNFIMGTGVNHVDGGAHAGSTPWGARGSDTLEVFAGSAATAAAASVTALDGTGSAEDVAAFGQGYTIRVAVGAETTYAKNVEQLQLMVWDDKNNNGIRDWVTEVTFVKNVALGTRINEIQIDANDATKTTWGANVADQFHFAWVDGGAAADTFDAADLTQVTKTRMTTAQRGINVDMGGGNDTAIGSDFGDNFSMGAGVNRVDGGANAGTTPWGMKATDTLDVYVANQAAANAVTVTALDGSGSAEDQTALGQGYAYKVVAGAEIDYVKNVEQVNVQIWNDANGNGQRDWGNGEVTFVRSVALSTIVNEIHIDPNDSTKTTWGAKVAEQFHHAWVNGSAGADTFNAATDISSATLTLMSANQRGVNVELGAGNDTATGSGFGDNFVMGAGVNRVDGGANAGTTPWGSKAGDSLDIFVADAAAAAAVTVSSLDGGGSAEDNSAHGAGYSSKVVSGAETTYIKNVEQVNVRIWNDANGNSQKDWGTEVTHARHIALATIVNEIQIDPNDSTKTTWGAKVTDQHHHAWVNGSAGADNFDAATDISAGTTTLMSSNQRGVFVDLGAGNDSATGSGFGDSFVMGAGVNRVDGGANAGNAPWGAKAADMLEIYVADQAAANAVTLTALDGSGSADDQAAHGDGFAYKATSGAETTYMKNVEQVDVRIWNDTNGNGQKDWGTEVTNARNIALATIVNEIQIDPNDATKTTWGAKVSEQHHHAWVNGSAGADTFNAATDISSATLTLMSANQRGVNVELGAGNDTATGSGFGDNFVMGAGVNHVDGGANAGTTPWGAKATDSLDIFVANQAAVNAVAVTALDGSGSPEDQAAAGQGYAYKVTDGAGTHYLKNVEQVNVQVWNDANGNGQKDWGTEVTFGRHVALATIVNEIQVDPNDATKTTWGAKLSEQFHYAWVNGSSGADTFNAATDISAGTLTLMSNAQRGIYVELGAGNDTATGSGFGDNFTMGAGTDRVDGDANAGATPFGDKARDSLDIFATSQAMANAVTVTALDGSGSAADVAAHVDGYAARVANGAAVTYVKNIESVNIQIWNDANANGQKDWGTEVTHGRNVRLALNVDEIRLDPNDSTKTFWGDNVANQVHLAWAYGSDGNEGFTVASDVSSATRALMTTHQRGLSVDLGAGNDTAVGSSYGDSFVFGAGTDFIDGGDQLGTQHGGNGPARDTLDVYVADQAAADALAYTVLDESATGADAAAFGDGYTGKLSSGASTTYLKNIEAVNVQIWNDANGDGLRQFPAELTPVSFTNLVPSVFQNTGDLATQFHMGSVNGTEWNDTLNLAAGSALIPGTLAANMATYQRGLFIQAGDGNDTIVGTAHGDAINGGAGINHIDGGTHTGTQPNSVNPPRDSLDLIVRNQADAQNVVVSVLAGATGLSGTDLQAQTDGYRYKVVSAATGETDYVKNVETLNIRIWDDANNNGQMEFHLNEVSTYRNRALATTYSDNVPTPANGTPSLGFANGTQYRDVITGANVLTAMGKTLDPGNPFGAFMTVLAGSDIVTGTAGTDFVVGTHSSATTPAIGSKLIDGASDAGYYYFANGTPAISQDFYRMLEQRAPGEVTNASLSNGGLVSGDFQLSKYKIVDLTAWASFGTTGLDQMTAAAAVDLKNIINGASLSETDATHIAAGAARVGLTGTGGQGYTNAILKYSTDGSTLLGIDFLKDIETVQLGLWYDSNRNDIVETNERTMSNTYVLKQDSYTLAEAHETWLNLTVAGSLRSYAGSINGSSLGETIDASGVTVPGYFDAGTGYRIGDGGGNDILIGTAGNDLIGLGAGNDNINGGGGTDTAAFFWSPGANNGAATLSSHETTDGNGITTITVRQTNNGGTFDLLTLVNDGTDDLWTLTSTGSGTSAFLHPSGLPNISLGTDVLVDVESVAIYLQGAAPAGTTPSISGATPFEIELVGVI